MTHNAKGPVIVACMPKSGSTWLTRALSAVTGYDIVQVSSHWVIQELDPARMARYQGRGLARMVRYQGRGSVGQIHLIASPHTIELLNYYRAKVLILTRKLPDIIVSLREFLHVPENINQLERDGVLQSAFYMIDRKFYDLSDKEQYDFLISFALPWYLWFAASWQKYGKELKCPPIWLSYDEIVADRAGVLTRTVDTLDLPHPSEIDKSIRVLGDTRLNVGVSGRGYNLLSDSQIAAIRDQISRYLIADLKLLL